MFNCEFLHNYKKYLAYCSKNQGIPGIAGEIVTLEEISKGAARKMKSHEVAS